MWDTQLWTLMDLISLFFNLAAPHHRSDHRPAAFAAASISARLCALTNPVEASRAASVSAAVDFVSVIFISLGHRMPGFVTFPSYSCRVTV